MPKIRTNLIAYLPLYSTRKEISYRSRFFRRPGPHAQTRAFSRYLKHPALSLAWEEAIAVTPFATNMPSKADHCLHHKFCPPVVKIPSDLIFQLHRCLPRTGLSSLSSLISEHIPSRLFFQIPLSYLTSRQSTFLINAVFSGLADVCGNPPFTTNWFFPSCTRLSSRKNRISPL